MDKLSELKQNISIAMESLKKAEKGYSEYLAELIARDADYKLIEEARNHSDSCTFEWRKTLHNAEMELYEYEKAQKATSEIIEEGIGTSG